MTDKEMAANWIKENVDSFRSSNMNAYEFAEQAFLAALKIGRPKWHKVADGDLPKQYKNTCFSIDVLANNNKKVYYCFGSGKWFHKNKEVKIIAWCEIPKYTER